MLEATKMRLEADFADVKANAGSVQKLLEIGSVADRPAVIELRAAN